MAQGTLAPGVAAYSGIINSQSEGDIEVHFLAPNKLFTRVLSTGEVWATNGEMWWSYNPVTGAAEVSDTPWPYPRLLARAFYPKFTELVNAAGDQEDSPYPYRRSILVAGHRTVAGREAAVLGTKTNYNAQHREVSGGRGMRFALTAQVIISTSMVGMPDPWQLYEVIGFTSIDLAAPPADPLIFEPHFPEGTLVARTESGPLESLVAKIGLPVRRPDCIPEGWDLAVALLTTYPETKPGSGAGGGGWRLFWQYGPGEIGMSTAVRITMTSRLPADLGIGSVVDLGSGVRAVCSPPDVGALPSLSWIWGDLYYQVVGASTGPDELPQRDFLVAVARNLMGGP